MDQPIYSEIDESELRPIILDGRESWTGVHRRHLSNLSLEVLKEHRNKAIGLFGQDAFNRCLENPCDFFLLRYEPSLTSGLDIKLLQEGIKCLPSTTKRALVGSPYDFDNAQERDWFYGEIHEPHGDEHNFITFMALKYQTSDINGQKKYEKGLRILTSNPRYVARMQHYSICSG